MESIMRSKILGGLLTASILAIPTAEAHTLSATPHSYKNPGCQSNECDARVGRKWWKKHHPKATIRAVESSGWAIPTYIVMCESHGQNLPPNGAGASGYYQIIPSTWAGYGGTRYASQAYLASKAEQDIVARAIWNGGGASQWDCA